MNQPKANIRLLSIDELRGAMEKTGARPYRAKQVWEWLWKFQVASFEEMTNIPQDLREQLSAIYDLPVARIDSETKSMDGTIKTVFRMADGQVVEGVLIPAEERMTACVSSQVGCSLTCSFCATGKMDRIRNLTRDEIFDQVKLIRDLAKAQYNVPLTNIVYMGMGEPLLNYKNVLESTERINAQDGLGISYQRITVSTAGIAKMIGRLADDKAKFNLALSLHAANDRKRSEIMPINEQNNLRSLLDALRYYTRNTGKKVTYEYIVFKNFNDTLDDAKELADFASEVPAKINLIEYNPVDGSPFKNAAADRLEAFKQYLHSRNFIVNTRRSRGKDIDAACGQLALKNRKQTQDNVVK